MQTRERPTLARRGFLSGLAGLPLIGGAVSLIGQPTAAAVPVTDELRWAYKDWLYMEHTMLSYELAGHDWKRGEGFVAAFRPASLMAGTCNGLTRAGLAVLPAGWTLLRPRPAPP